jgi:hypothetical protein
MKPIIWIALFMVLNVGILVPASVATAGEKRNSNATSSHKKATEKNDAQWAADPKRGWVRTEERRQSNDSDRAPGDNRYDGKQKSKGKANKS